LPIFWSGTTALSSDPPTSVEDAFTLPQLWRWRSVTSMLNVRVPRLNSSFLNRGVRSLRAQIDQPGRAAGSPRGCRQVDHGIAGDVPLRKASRPGRASTSAARMICVSILPAGFAHILDEVGQGCVRLEGRQVGETLQAVVDRQESPPLVSWLKCRGAWFRRRRVFQMMAKPR